GTASLAPTAGADTWMEGSVEERRESAALAIGGEEGTPSRLFDLLEEDWAAREESQAEIMPWIRTSFSFVPSTTFIRFADFAEYQAAVGSPLAAATLGGPGEPG